MKKTRSGQENSSYLPFAIGVLTASFLLTANRLYESGTSINEAVTEAVGETLVLCLVGWITRGVYRIIKGSPTKMLDNANLLSDSVQPADTGRVGDRDDTKIDMNFCVDCGHVLRPNANFCIHCGKSVSK